MTQQPQIKYRHDYRAPEYTITDIDLTFELDASTTRVTAISRVKRLGDSRAELRLDGEALTLIALEVDGQARRPSVKKRAHWSSASCRKASP